MQLRRIAWLLSALIAAGPLPAQEVPVLKRGGSPLVRMLSHVPMDGYFRAGGLDIEQELARPYVYVSRMLDEAGFTIVNLADPEKPRVIYDWRFPNLELHQGLGGENLRYFKTRGRYYLAKTSSFEASSPDADLGMVIFEVTGLPDPSKVREVARVKGGGVTHVFPYKHSDGRLLLITTPRGPYANVYDADKLLAGDAREGLIGRVPVPGDTGLNRAQDGTMRSASYHDTYAAYDPVAKQDRVYGAGSGGFHAFDFSKPESPRYLTTITPGAGVVAGGHTFTVSPDGRYAVGNIERQFWPIMIFELKPAMDQQRPVTTPIGGWTADWQDASHTHELRWPYVFVASFEDGLQIVSLIDPRHPKTVGWYHTCECEHQTGWGGLQSPHASSVFNGAADVDVRNADGLIALTDYTSGLWVFHLDGFDGWNGKDWQMPNISSAQMWDAGPTGLRP